MIQTSLSRGYTERRLSNCGSEKDSMELFLLSSLNDNLRNPEIFKGGASNQWKISRVCSASQQANTDGAVYSLNPFLDTQNLAPDDTRIHATPRRQSKHVDQEAQAKSIRNMRRRRRRTRIFTINSRRSIGVKGGLYHGKSSRMKGDLIIKLGRRTLTITSYEMRMLLAHALFNWTERKDGIKIRWWHWLIRTNNTSNLHWISARLCALHWAFLTSLRLCSCTRHILVCSFCSEGLIQRHVTLSSEARTL